MSCLSGMSEQMHLSRQVCERKPAAKMPVANGFCLAGLLLILVPMWVQADALKRCEVQQYPGECTIRRHGPDVHLSFFQNGDYREGYRWTKIGSSRYRDEGGIVWSESRSGLSTIYKSRQCPPRMSCMIFTIQVWD